MEGRKGEEARCGVDITNAGEGIRLQWAGFARLGKGKGLSQGNIETEQSEIIGEFRVCLAVSEEASLAGVDNCVQMSSKRCFRSYIGFKSLKS